MIVGVPVPSSNTLTATRTAAHTQHTTAQQHTPTNNATRQPHVNHTRPHPTCTRHLHVHPRAPRPPSLLWHVCAVVWCVLCVLCVLCVAGVACVLCVVCCVVLRVCCVCLSVLCVAVLCVADNGVKSSTTSVARPAERYRKPVAPRSVS